MIECLSVVESIYFFLFLFYCLFSDIDECTNATHNCHYNATCTNLDGSFNCTCDPGYMGNGTYCEGKFRQGKLIFKSLKGLNGGYFFINVPLTL